MAHRQYSHYDGNGSCFGILLLTALSVVLWGGGSAGAGRRYGCVVVVVAQARRQNGIIIPAASIRSASRSSTKAPPRVSLWNNKGSSYATGAAVSSVEDRYYQDPDLVLVDPSSVSPQHPQTAVWLGGALFSSSVSRLVLLVGVGAWVKRTVVLQWWKQQQIRNHQSVPTKQPSNNNNNNNNATTIAEDETVTTVLPATTTTTSSNGTIAEPSSNTSVDMSTNDATIPPEVLQDEPVNWQKEKFDALLQENRRLQDDWQESVHQLERLTEHHTATLSLLATVRGELDEARSQETRQQQQFLESEDALLATRLALSEAQQAETALLEQQTATECAHAARVALLHTANEQLQATLQVAHAKFDATQEIVHQLQAEALQQQEAMEQSNRDAEMTFAIKLKKERERSSRDLNRLQSDMLDVVQEERQLLLEDVQRQLDALRASIVVVDETEE